MRGLVSKQKTGSETDDGSTSDEAVPATAVHSTAPYMKIKRILAFHRPLPAKNASGSIDPDRQPICAGCEVFYWPCPTVRLADGTWESVPTLNDPI